MAAAWRNRGVGRPLMTVLIGWCGDHADIERGLREVFSHNETALMDVLKLMSVDL